MASLASDYDSDKNPISQMSEKSALLKLDGSLAVSRSWVVKNILLKDIQAVLALDTGVPLWNPNMLSVGT